VAGAAESGCAWVEGVSTIAPALLGKRTALDTIAVAMVTTIGFNRARPCESSKCDGEERAGLGFAANH
jgi:hypothetical protein